MTAHIIKLVEDLINHLKNDEGTYFRNDFTMITEEVNLLNTSNVSPSHRYDFIKIRQFFRDCTSSGYNYAHTRGYVPTCEKLIVILENYNKINSIENPRNFNFITNESLREIIERDYKEMSNILMPDGAWKSAVILSGSILEAILYDQLTNERYNQLALECRSAPKFRSEVKPIDEWKLKEMIIVAEKIDCLPSQRAKSFDQVLRDYRNFVHPLVEIRSQHPCTQAEALMAQGALEAVYKSFQHNTRTNQLVIYYSQTHRKWNRRKVIQPDFVEALSLSTYDSLTIVLLVAPATCRLLIQSFNQKTASSWNKRESFSKFQEAIKPSRIVKKGNSVTWL